MSCNCCVECLNSCVVIFVLSFVSCVFVVVGVRFSLCLVVDRLFSFVVLMNSWMLFSWFM